MKKVLFVKKYYEILKELREDHDLSQEAIAQLLGTTRSYYGQYERGLFPLTIEHLITLCNYYKVSADYILGISYNYDRPVR